LIAFKYFCFVVTVAVGLAALMLLVSCYKCEKTNTDELWLPWQPGRVNGGQEHDCASVCLLRN